MEKTKDALYGAPGDATYFCEDHACARSVECPWPKDLERLHKEKPSAANLLSLSSFFERVKIPISSLQAYSRMIPAANKMRTADAKNERLGKDVGTLQASSFVVAEDDSGTLGLSDLTQRHVSAWLEACGRTGFWEQTYVDLMAQEFPNGEFVNWTRCRRLFPHVERLCFDYVPTIIRSSDALAHLLTNAAWYLWRTEEHSLAYEIVNAASTIRQNLFGWEDERTLDSSQIKASILASRGELEEAEQLNRSVLAGFNRTLGAGHSSTLTSASNLALLLHHKGEYEKAEALSRWTVHQSKAVLGACHTDTLTSVSNLSLSLQHQGRYEEAKSLDRQVLQGFIKQFGPRHPSSLTAMSNLAIVLQCQGRFRESEKLHRRALAGRLEMLGVRNSSTQSSVENLVALLLYQGKSSDMVLIQRQILEQGVNEATNWLRGLRVPGSYIRVAALHGKAWIKAAATTTLVCARHLCAAPHKLGDVDQSYLKAE